MDKASQYLMQKSESSDAVLIQKNQDNFNQLMAAVLSRLAEAHTQLHKISAGPVTDYELQLKSHYDSDGMEQDLDTYVCTFFCLSYF